MVVPAQGYLNVVHDRLILSFICEVMIVQSIDFKTLDPTMVMKLPFLIQDDMTKRE